LIKGHASSFRAKDSEFWLENTFWKEKTEKLDVYLLMQDRWKEQASLLYHQAVEGGLQYSFLDKWSLAASYRQIFVKEDDKWLLEANPRFSMTRKEKWKNWAGSIRHLVEYKGRSHNLTYRNRLQADIFSQAYPALHLFLMNEIFIEEEFTQNRFRFGVKSPPNSFLQTTIAYQFQLKKLDSSWYGINAAYLAFTLIF